MQRSCICNGHTRISFLLPYSVSVQLLRYTCWYMTLVVDVAEHYSLECMVFDIANYSVVVMVIGDCN